MKRYEYTVRRNPITGEWEGWLRPRGFGWILMAEFADELAAERTMRRWIRDGRLNEGESYTRVAQMRS